MAAICRVCGEPTDATSEAECLRCLQPFHLALRQDVPAKDCGEVWLSDELMALEFACAICLAEERGTPLPQPLAAPPAPTDAPERPTPAGRRYARHEGMRAADVARRRRRGR